MLIQKSYYTVKELAEHWGVTAPHIYNQIRAGQITAVRIGSVVRIAHSERMRIEGQKAVA